MDYIKEDPSKNVELYNLKRSENIIVNYINHNEALELIEQPLRPKIIDPSWVRVRDHAILGTIYYCGLRTQEVAGLKISDVKLKESKVIVRKSKGNLTRTIPLVREHQVILEYYFEQMEQSRFGDHLFFSKRNSVSQKMRFEILSRSTVKRLDLRSEVIR